MVRPRGPVVPVALGLEWRKLVVVLLLLLLVMMLGLALTSVVDVRGWILGTASPSIGPAAASATAAAAAGAPAPQVGDLLALLVALEAQPLDQSFRVVQTSLHLHLGALEHPVDLDTHVRRLGPFFRLLDEFQ